MFAIEETEGFGQEWEKPGGEGWIVAAGVWRNKDHQCSNQGAPSEKKAGVSCVSAPACTHAPVWYVYGCVRETVVCMLLQRRDLQACLCLIGTWTFCILLNQNAGAAPVSLRMCGKLCMGSWKLTLHGICFNGTAVVFFLPTRDHVMTGNRVASGLQSKSHNQKGHMF